MSSTNGTHPENVVLRIAKESDRPALVRLAELDSDIVPALPLLIAEADGRAVAAWSMSEQRAIADPFRPTAHIVGLLREHATAADPGRARSGHVSPIRRALGHAGPRMA